MERPDVTVVLPCRNEEAAIGICIREVLAYLEKAQLRGEILVADNGSADRSGEIARGLGARVIREEKPGYGNALRAGIAAARGKIILMGDSDTTYDFMELGKLYEPLARGLYDMMIGDRFAGGMEPGAMSVSHQLGVRFLSAAGRRRFHTDVRDFHCGLRGLTREAAEQLDFRTEGMEFATEMIALAARAGLRIGQCPVRLRKCGLNRKSKLKTLPDGVRHMRYITGSREDREKHGTG